VGLIVGGVVLLLGAGAFAAWVWPGFLSGSGLQRGTGDENLVAYVPRGCNMFVGADIGGIEKMFPGTQAKLAQLFQNASRGQAPKGAVDALLKADQLLTCANMDGGKTAVAVIVRFREPFKIDEMEKLFSGSDRQTSHGKPYFKMGGSTAGFVGMPNDRIILIHQTKNGLEEMLASDGSTPSISGSALAIAQAHSKGLIWFALDLNDSLKGLMNLGLANMPIPGLKDLRASMNNMKAVGVSLSGTDSIELYGEVICTDAATAAKETQKSQKQWDTDGKKTLSAAKFGAKLIGLASGGQLIDDIIKSVKFETRGSSTLILCSTRKATVEKCVAELMALAEKANPGGGGFGGQGGGGMQGRPVPRGMGAPGGGARRPK
jgi:hypothetical protein